MIVHYGLKPNTYMRPVNSFQEFPHSIDDEEVFLFSPLPDSDGTHLISREFDPPIRQTLVVALCVDEKKPVSVHFYNYLKHFEEKYN